MDQRVAVVTGAGSGIGRTVALALLNDGYFVALAGRRQEPLQETASLARLGTSLIVPTDVTHPHSVDTLFATVKAQAGRLDVLFNNAGIGAPTTNFGDVTFEQWQSVVAVNLNGMFLCASGANRAMRDQSPQGGRIINNGSISAHTPRPGSAAYTATKHAVVALTKSAALEEGGQGIRINAVCPGAIMTPLMERGSPERRLEIRRPQAMKRFGEPEEVAAAVVWLCSDDASFVTGVAMPVDAGSVAGW